METFPGPEWRPSPEYREARSTALRTAADLLGELAEHAAGEIPLANNLPFQSEGRLRVAEILELGVLPGAEAAPVADLELGASHTTFWLYDGGRAIKLVHDRLAEAAGHRGETVAEFHLRQFATPGQVNDLEYRLKRDAPDQVVRRIDDQVVEDRSAAEGDFGGMVQALDALRRQLIR